MKDGFYAVRNGEIYEIEIQCPFPKNAKTIKIPMINPFVVTNGDHVRAMNDEELSAFLCDIASRTGCYGDCIAMKYCHAGHTGMGDWLRQPYKEEKK